jgi:hypothetical protein
LWFGSKGLMGGEELGRREERKERGEKVREKESG